MRIFCTMLLVLALTAPAGAATIQVGPTDSYAKIEAAKAGDEVVIAPGTYAFRVHLTEPAPAGQPIVIRALDPANPPVWDLGAVLVENAPGSYTAGDRGRGCWQISGGTNYHISGIVLTNCHNAANNSAGMRYYNGAVGIQLKDCVFRGSDNGLTGGTQDSEITVEFCEFDANGSAQAPASAPSHNLYIYGGTFTLRYSYVHDPVQAQNFHIRSKVGTIEYNWFARGRSYEGDLMTDDDFSGAGPFTQSLLLRGNVIVQSAAPNNTGQIIAIYNDAGLANLTLNLRLLDNTLIGNGGHAALVHVSNADGTAMTAELSNNLVSGTNTALLVETAGAATVSGTNNWMATGGAAPGLAATVFSADPGFKDPANQDYTLAAGSAALNAASAAPAGLPDKEYFKNETQSRGYRPRSTVKDIGAFDSTTTGAGIGPYGQPPAADGGVPPSPDLATAATGDGGGGGGTPRSGCGCRLGGAAGSPASALALAGLLLGWLLRRRAA